MVDIHVKKRHERSLQRVESAKNAFILLEAGNCPMQDAGLQHSRGHEEE